MLDSLMLLGIGFLAACIVMAMLAPLIHERAVRLTTARNLASQPMSMTEMRAHADQQRAEFAMKTRRLEMSIQELQAKLAGQHGDFGRWVVEVERLKAQLRQAHVALLEAQARELARKSMAHRIVKLFVYLLVRSHRQRALQESTPLFQARKPAQARA
jgi:hypothetical protein